jgi:hypothetical protein
MQVHARIKVVLEYSKGIHTRAQTCHKTPLSTCRITHVWSYLLEVEAISSVSVLDNLKLLSADL